MHLDIVYFESQRLLPNNHFFDIQMISFLSIISLLMRGGRTTRSSSSSGRGDRGSWDLTDVKGWTPFLPCQDKETEGHGPRIIYHISTWSMILEVIFPLLFVSAIMKYGCRSSVECFLVLELMEFLMTSISIWCTIRTFPIFENSKNSGRRFEPP